MSIGSAILARHAILECRTYATSMTSVRPSICLSICNVGGLNCKSGNRNMTGYGNVEFCTSAETIPETVQLSITAIEHINISNRIRRIVWYHLLAHTATGSSRNRVRNLWNSALSIARPAARIRVISASIELAVTQ